MATLMYFTHQNLVVSFICYMYVYTIVHVYTCMCILGSISFGEQLGHIRCTCTCTCDFHFGQHVIISTNLLDLFCQIIQPFFATSFFILVVQYMYSTWTCTWTFYLSVARVAQLQENHPATRLSQNTFYVLLGYMYTYILSR